MLLPLQGAALIEAPASHPAKLPRMVPRSRTECFARAQALRGAEGSFEAACVACTGGIKHVTWAMTRGRHRAMGQHPEQGDLDKSKNVGQGLWGGCLVRAGDLPLEGTAAGSDLKGRNSAGQSESTGLRLAIGFDPLAAAG